MTPINFNLKSNLEKEAILNSYKIFLKTCNFDMQILVRSTQEDISKQINMVKNKVEDENENLKQISEEYIKYLKNLIQNKESSSKQFFILIKNIPEKNDEKIVQEDLNDKYLKIKECLSRCGNFVYEIDSKEDVQMLLSSFFKIQDNKEV